MHSFGLCGCAPPPGADELFCMQCDDDERPTLSELPSPMPLAMPLAVAPPAKRQKMEVEYPPLPSKSRRIKGAIYRISEGVYKKWNGKQLQSQCGVCAIKSANYPDQAGGPRKLCADHAREKGTYAVQNPCRDCPDDAKLQAAYKDEDGRCNKLCADHARGKGTYTVQNPCRDCPDDAKIDAAYKDEDGRCNKLCADHARGKGTYTVKNPCRDCPDDAKLQAHYKDEDGRCNKLCADHAREKGTYTVKNPCRDCPDDAKLQAAYKDEDGRCGKLCADHAREKGTYAVLNPCRDCPDDAKLQANYKDEDGRCKKLCADHAREKGTYAVQNPCRDCPDDAKIEANYKDEDGRCGKLCAECAFEAGLKPLAAAGASMAACQCWHRLEHVSTAKLTHHVHFVKGSATPVGEEKAGLISGRRFKPDAFVEPGLPIHLPNETSGPKGAVYLYHGNEWHGYPPGHPKYEGTNWYDTPYKELYQRTLKQQELYRDEGYRVFAVWEHEYQTTTTAKCPVHILGVVREV